MPKTVKEKQWYKIYVLEGMPLNGGVLRISYEIYHHDGGEYLKKKQGVFNGKLKLPKESVVTIAIENFQ